MGYPRRSGLTTGLLFNSAAFENYASKRGFHHKPVTPEQPSSNGLAENFMRMLKKVAHAAYVEHKDPKEAVYRYLLSYRATPHSATGKAPSEALYNRMIRTPVPHLKVNEADPELTRRDEEHKRKMKEYHDRRRHTKPIDLHIGDRVLAPQRSSTTKPPFNPQPLTVIRKRGTAVTAVGPNRRRPITRASSKFKKLTPRLPQLEKFHRHRREEVVSDSDEDIFLDLKKRVAEPIEEAVEILDVPANCESEEAEEAAEADPIEEAIEVSDVPADSGSDEAEEPAEAAENSSEYNSCEEGVTDSEGAATEPYAEPESENETISESAVAKHGRTRRRPKHLDDYECE